IGATFVNGYGTPGIEGAQLAKEMDIPHHIIDVQDIFAQKIINPFIRAYLDGKTPNPCVTCNPNLKFAVLMPLLEQYQADWLATGHYVRIQERDGRYQLSIAVDPSKDQSYFLFALPQDILAHCLFPLGDYTKEQIRNKAAAFGLSVAAKKDSQDICFIPDGDYRSLLRQRVAESLIPGAIIDMEGKEVGRHQGLACYTIGQRRGLDLALGYPAYVTALDIATNSLRVGSKEDTYTDRVVVEQAVFQPFAVLTKKLTVKVKIRYKAKPVSATISPLSDGNILMHLKQPESAVTPGQAAVWYGEDQLIGGGIIKNAWRE
ncbi:MAG: tRNA 2-thiouridine(34) synthase MnmA, partial [Clostridiales bacterium]